MSQTNKILPENKWVIHFGDLGELITQFEKTAGSTFLWGNMQIDTIMIWPFGHCWTFRLSQKYSCANIMFKWVFLKEKNRNVKMVKVTQRSNSAKDMSKLLMSSPDSLMDQDNCSVQLCMIMSLAILYLILSA